MARARKPEWLLSGSGVAIDTLRNQLNDKGAEQGFAAPARIVHKLEEAEVEGQFVLRPCCTDPPIGAWSRLSGRSFPLTLDAHLAVQAEPRLPPS